MFKKIGLGQNVHAAINHCPDWCNTIIKSLMPNIDIPEKIAVPKQISLLIWFSTSTLHITVELIKKTHKWELTDQRRRRRQKDKRTLRWWWDYVGQRWKDVKRWSMVKGLQFGDSKTGHPLHQQISGLQRRMVCSQVIFGSEVWYTLYCNELI